MTIVGYVSNPGLLVREDKKTYWCIGCVPLRVKVDPRLAIEDSSAEAQESCAVCGRVLGEINQA